ncbi:carbohydrate binding domain-containing protein [Chitinispirillales bacterium ANBcel5]|uniref:carbohydrate binding domain-containing protein n=1 Tax=Cellulosispirillum alkaliphilum TaxID=3039283 RepID=UPI002A5238BD|nr:carbohydrate binding domain-containing protein [Chitinispirillales bacterium ANBcel5]
MKFLACVIYVLLLCTHSFSQQNLIINGDFSNDSYYEEWTFHAMDAQAIGEIVDGQYIITIEADGSLEYSPQLYQSGLTLERSEAYLLTFTVSAQNEGVLRAFPSLNHEPFTPYIDSIESVFEIGPEPTSHSVTFIMKEPTDPDARIQFNCGVSSELQNITIENVSLVKLDEPVIEITSPGMDTRWNTGSERKITWENSGSLSHVSILFSKDNGQSWHPITNSVQNSKEFTWDIPQEAESNQCKIVVRDLSGLYADTSTLFQIVHGGAISEGELVRNGTFFDSTDWYFETNPPASATGLFEDEFIVKIDNVGHNPWEIKLYQKGFKLNPGSSYKFSFDAYASEPRTIFANIGLTDPPWTSFSGGDTIPKHLTTEKTTFSDIFFISSSPEADSRIEFNLGNELGDVYIDNVSLIEIRGEGIFLEQPNAATVWQNNSNQIIKWETAENHDIVSVEYSINGGQNWNLISGDVVFAKGELRWFIPDINTEDAQIRIISQQTDEVIASSAPFEINSIGIPMRYGELIINGNFSQFETGWNSLSTSNHAQAHGFVENDIYNIRIDYQNGGASDIIFSQSNLPLMAQNEYTLSFDAYTAGNRQMLVRLICANDQDTVLFESTQSLPQEWQTFNFIFTPRMDANSRLEFHVGGSHASVYLNNISLTTQAPLPTSANFSIKPPQSRKLLVSNTTPGIVRLAFSEKTQGTITIFNLRGKNIRTLHLDRDYILWDRTDRAGNPVARGSYIIQFRDNLGQITHPLVLY